MIEEKAECKNSVFHKIFIWGTAAVVAFWGGLCCSSLVGRVNGMLLPHYISMLCAAGAYFLCHFYGKKEESENQKRQLCRLNLIFFILNAVVLIYSVDLFCRSDKQKWLVTEIIWLIITGMVYFGIWRGGRRSGAAQAERSKNRRIAAFFAFIKGRRFLLLLLAVAVALAMSHSLAVPKWDSAVIYSRMADKSLISLFYLQELVNSAHVNLAYVALNIIAGAVAGDMRLGMAAANIAVMALSICAVYGTLKAIRPGKGEEAYVAGAAVYAFSPFVLGMVNCLFWDYWVVCIFTFVVYFTIKKEWLYQIVAGFLFCFLKEPCILIYGAICFGVLLAQFLAYKGQRAGARLKRLAACRKYWFMVYIAICWFIIYKLLTHWQGAGGFVWDLQYIFNKLKVLYVLNFNWIFGVLSLAAVIFLIWRNRKEKKRIWWLLPLVISDIAFIVFSCLFLTVNHARYINSHIVCLYLLAVLMLFELPRRFGNTALAALAVLMLCSSYWTLDPLTKLVFPRLNIGSTVMVYTQEGERLSDSMVYNRQYLYFEDTLNLALSDVAAEQGVVHLFPLINHNVWFFDGMNPYMPAEDYVVLEEYWDNSLNRRKIEGEEQDTTLPIINISEETDIGALVGQNTGYYFYLPFAGTEIAQRIKEEFAIIEEKEFKYRGWGVRRLCFRADGSLK